MEYKNLKELKIKENIVLRTIVDIYNKHQHNGEVSVSSTYITTLNQEVGTEGNVRKIIQKLIDKGLIDKVRGGNYAAKAAPVYTINFHKINSMEVEEDMYDDTDVNINSAEVIRLLKYQNNMLKDQNKMLHQLIGVINDKFVAKNNSEMSKMPSECYQPKSGQKSPYTMIDIVDK